MKKNEIFDSLDLIKSSKLNSSQTIEYYIGFVYRLILDKKIFPNNPDLKEFIYTIFLEPNDLIQFKDYVYKSRTLLGARTCRMISENFTFTDILNQVDNINNIFVRIYNVKTSNSNAHKSVKAMDNALENWMNKLRDNDD